MGLGPRMHAAQQQSEQSSSSATVLRGTVASYSTTSLVLAEGQPYKDDRPVCVNSDSEIFR